MSKQINKYKIKIPDFLVELIRGMHPHLRKKVRKSLQTILDEPASGKALKNELKGMRSFRISKFRIIYRISTKKEIEIIAIGPRKCIYEETLRLIRKS